MDEINQKIQGVARDSRQYVENWYFDTDNNQVVFNTLGGVPLRLGFKAVEYLPHSAICELIRTFVQEQIH